MPSCSVCGLLKKRVVPPLRYEQFCLSWTTSIVITNSLFALFSYFLSRTSYVRLNRPSSRSGNLLDRLWRKRRCVGNLLLLERKRMKHLELLKNTSARLPCWKKNSVKSKRSSSARLKKKPRWNETSVRHCRLPRASTSTTARPLRRLLETWISTSARSRTLLVVFKEWRVSWLKRSVKTTSFVLRMNAPSRKIGLLVFVLENRRPLGVNDLSERLNE
jgi:hypothetical protein